VGKEVERKFLVINDKWKKDVTESYTISRGYILHNELLHARIRVINYDDESRSAAYLTIKSNEQYERDEFEYEIPLEDGEQMMKYATTIVGKSRHIIPIARGMKWEIDVFDNGIVIAEIELICGEEGPVIPNWLGKDVTRDPAYYNVNIENMGK
jgi:adenylate cyclase